MKLQKYKNKDPKKIGIMIFTVICILLVAGVFIYTSFASFETNETFNIIRGKVQDPGDLYFAFYIDDEISSRMPQKGEGYVLDTEKTTCTNGASIDFNTEDWSIKVLNMTKTRTKCTLYFEQSGAGYIKEIYENGSDELVDDEAEDHNIRYIGADPNNYVLFNNERWRIIGVMNNIDDGTGTNETRLKIIRNEPIGEYSWDNKPSGTGSSDSEYGSNDWSDSTLQEVLNNGAYWNRTTGECPSGQNGTTTPCDFSSTGLTEEAKTMVSNVVWNLGGSSIDDDATTSMFYERERGAEIYSGRPTKWIGKIGLMYASDYGYATSGSSSTSRDMCLNAKLYNEESSYTSDCYNNDWLYKGVNQRTLTTVSNHSYRMFYVRSDGNVTYTRVYYSLAVSPALYLNSNVRIVSGEGTESNPFVLKL